MGGERFLMGVKIDVRMAHISIIALTYSLKKDNDDILKIIKEEKLCHVKDIQKVWHCP